MPLDPGRTVSELEELHALGGGTARLAWTPAWEQARSWLTGKAASTRATMEFDPAGNQWLTLGGDSAATLVIGGHLDSTPGAGVLDGPLGLLAGLEVLRRLDGAGIPPATVKLVSWADSEGARFGRSLLGSTLARWPSRQRGHGRRPARRPGRHRVRRGSRCPRRGRAGREQAGPARAASGTPWPAWSWRRPPTPASAKPRSRRRTRASASTVAAITWRPPAGYEAPPADATTAAAAQLAARVGKFAVTSPFGADAQIVELRDAHEERLGRRLVAAVEASNEIGRERGLQAAWERLWRIPPVHFDEELTRLAHAAIGRRRSRSPEPKPVRPSDVSELARTGVPSAMLLLATPGGTTAGEPVESAVLALDTLVTDVLDALASGRPPFFKIS